MIRYVLRCERGHSFESWFKDSAAFDAQVERQLLSCPSCGSAKVEKAVMAPSVAKRTLAKRPAEPAPPDRPAAAENRSVAILDQRERELRAKLKELRDHLISNADYVGTRFPEEARKMHYGEIEHRSIYGEASAEEAAALAEEGIEFHPLPQLP